MTIQEQLRVIAGELDDNKLLNALNHSKASHKVDCDILNKLIFDRDKEIKRLKDENNSLRNAFDKFAQIASLVETPEQSIHMVAICETIGYDLYNEEFIKD